MPVTILRHFSLRDFLTAQTGLLQASRFKSKPYRKSKCFHNTVKRMSEYYPTSLLGEPADISKEIKGLKLGGKPVTGKALHKS